MKLKPLSLALLTLGFAVMGQAEDSVKANNNIVRFSTEIEKEVSYDLMQVRLYVQEEDSNLKTLNQNINEKVNQALAEIKKQHDVQLKDSSRNNQVRYDNKGKQSGWIGRAEIVLESQDFNALAQLLTTLNQTFAIADMNPQVSTAKRASLEKEMIESALTQFKLKAETIQTTLNAKGYQIINLNLNTPQDAQNYYHVRPVAYSARMMAADSADTVKVTDGKTNLKASVEAEIQLLQNAN